MSMPSNDDFMDIIYDLEGVVFDMENSNTYPCDDVARQTIDRSIQKINRIREQIIEERENDRSS